MNATPLTVLLFLLASFTSLSQVGIGTTSPDSSSILDLTSSSQGFLPPRLTTAERVAIPTPANGLMVYDINKELLYVFSAGLWLAVNPWTTNYSSTGDITTFTNGETGRIGIGISNPTEKLDVNGAIKTRGLRFPEATDLDASTVTGQSNKNYLSFGDSTNNEFDFLGYENNTLVLDKSPGNTTNPNFEISGDFSAEHISGYGTIPLGGIIMWSGSSVPSGWALCNGQTVNSITTPNLSNKFIVSSGSSYALNNTGGNGSVALTAANIPKHRHTVNINTSSAGSHSHIVYGNEGTGVTDGSSSDYFLNNGGANRTESTSAAGAHNHNVNGNSGYYGGNTSGGVNAFSIIPPYYSLAFIMRIE